MNYPKPFCLNKKTFKVFVLGADPTNFSNNGKPKVLEYAFGILSDEPRYFDRTLKNLNQIGLHLEDIYVQNVLQEHLMDETSKNKEWEAHAQRWLPKLKKEFDSISKAKRKPILVTAERIMKFLVNDDFELPSARNIYFDDREDLFIIKPKDNKLGRPIMAFYSFSMYGIERNDKYREFLSNKFAKKGASLNTLLYLSPN